jgi:hypothetical protein
MKRAVREKERRAHGFSSRSAVARLLQRSAVSPRDSRKVGKGEYQEKRHRQGRNNSNVVAASLCRGVP